MTSSTDRRRFIATSASALAIPALATSTIQAAPPVQGKDQRLTTLKPFPAVLETPTKLLMKSRITPIDRLFVRNNQQPKDAATTKPGSGKGWKITFGGLLNQPFSLTVEDLYSLETTEYEMVLQCSGNGRAIFSQTAKTKGTQWGKGGMGNVRFKGVALKTILNRYNAKVLPQAKFIAAEGRDTPLPGKEDFEHSLPAGEVINRSILATHLNGQLLPAIHGGPVRLITPGVYGTMQMKWLSRLRFESLETPNYNQIPRYRVPITPIRPGSKIKYTFQNSRFNWKMKVKSVVLSHASGEKINAGNQTITGVAFNDGAARIDAVHVSLDKGQSWRRAKLNRPRSPYAWTRFQFTTKFASGTHEVWTRAVDGLGRSQPLDGSIHWNPSGYEWNGVEKIRLVVA